MPLNAAAAVARGNKRKAHHAEMSRKNGVIEQQRKVRQAVDVNMNYAKTTSRNVIGNACCQSFEKKGKGKTRRCQTSTKPAAG
jgi:nitrogenase subunit NifH